MNEIFFISDLHFDHKNILQFSPNRYGSNIKEHNEWLIEQWNSVVTKRDVVWVLGDACFSMESIQFFKRMRGQKNLVRGNHDKLSTKTYLEVFNGVFGLVKKNGFWLSHAPIHPLELRGCKNIHGHVHNNPIPDERYINVCVEALNGVPISLTELVRKHPRNNNEQFETND